MCGIAAIFAYSEAAPPVDRGELRRTRDQMAARGPDSAGEWYAPDGRVALAHRRLAILDLSPAGAQPMLSQDQSQVVTFNGEIYNYPALRRALEQRGWTLQSHSDTEILLCLYAEKGPRMLRDLRGMYAFAIWDAAKRGLFVARDPFGIKPLYYADDGHVFRLASQVKALLAGGQLDTTLEPAGHVGYWLWGHVPEPFTLYRRIRSVPAGSWLWVDAAGPSTPRRFCEPAQLLREAEAERAAPPPAGRLDVPALRAMLSDSVRHHLLADVPVGVFLSSGLDSTTLAALVAESGAELRSVTLGFEEYRGTAHDEVPLAELVAQRYGARHETVWVKREDFRARLPALLDAMDQPSLDGVNSYFVSLAAARVGLKVALSGLGGDEVFGGYPSFQEIPRAVRRLRWLTWVPGLGRAFRFVSASLLRRFTSPKYASLLEYGGRYAGAYLLRRGLFMPWELPRFLDGEMVRQGWEALRPLARLDDTLSGLRDARRRVAALEMTWYMRNQLLRDTDWASMAHSLEVRVPLVDVEVLRAVAPHFSDPPPPSKLLLAQCPSQPLPDALLRRPKTGFTVPVRDWLRGDAAAPGERGLRGWARFVHAAFQRN